MPIALFVFILLLVMVLSLGAGYAFGRFTELKKPAVEERIEVNPHGYEMSKPKKRKSRLDFGNQLDPVMPQGTLRDPIIEEKEEIDE